MQQNTQYLVKIEGGRAVLKVLGKACYLNCSNAGAFFAKLAEQRIESLEIELSECAGMDSTFLGMIAGAALKMREYGGSVSLLNPTPRVAETAENLGLDKLVQVRAGPQAAAPAEALANAGAATGSILRAHQDLVAADARNAEKFEDVIAFLKREKS